MVDPEDTNAVLSHVVRTLNTRMEDTESQLRNVCKVTEAVFYILMKMPVMKEIALREKAELTTIVASLPMESPAVMALGTGKDSACAGVHVKRRRQAKTPQQKILSVRETSRFILT
jgi:hypothetical protein